MKRTHVTGLALVLIVIACTNCATAAEPEEHSSIAVEKIDFQAMSDDSLESYLNGLDWGAIEAAPVLLQHPRTRQVDGIVPYETHKENWENWGIYAPLVKRDGDYPEYERKARPQQVEPKRSRWLAAIFVVAILFSDNVKGNELELIGNLATVIQKNDPKGKGIDPTLASILVTGTLLATKQIKGDRVIELIDEESK